MDAGQMQDDEPGSRFRVVSQAGRLPRFLRALLAAVVPLLVVAEAVAIERWNVQTFHDSHDVPFQEVKDLLEDNDGAIWIATWGGGLTRIRGTQWRTYDELNGLPSNWVRALEMDGEGNVWAGTTRGLCRFDGDRWTTFTQEDVPEFPSDGIRDIERLRDESLWIAFDDCPVVLSYRQLSDSGETRWETVTDDAETLFIEQTGDGRVWTGLIDSGRLRSFDGRRWREAAFPQATGRVRCVFEDREGAVIAARDSSLWRINDDYQAQRIHQFQPRPPVGERKQRNDSCRGRPPPNPEGHVEVHLRRRISHPDGGRRRRSLEIVCGEFSRRFS